MILFLLLMIVNRNIKDKNINSIMFKDILKILRPRCFSNEMFISTRHIYYCSLNKKTGRTAVVQEAFKLGFDLYPHTQNPLNPSV